MHAFGLRNLDFCHSLCVVTALTNHSIQATSTTATEAVLVDLSPVLAQPSQYP